MNDRYQEHRTPTVASAADEQAATRVDRAQTELKHGRVVRLIDCDPPGDVVTSSCVVAAVEALTPLRLRWLSSLGAPVHLLLTTERALALGMKVGAPGPLGAQSIRLPLPADISLDALHGLAAVTSIRSSTPGILPMSSAVDHLTPSNRARAADSAFQLARRARLIPALLVVDVSSADEAALAAEQLLWVSSADVSQMPLGGSASLRRVSDAQVPLAAHDDCELVLFREDHGGAEHVAIVVGQPDFSQPVPVRLHSSCLTGDLLGSLRCDCGDQLRRAIERLAETGGVLLYLEQEGRSIGLANKLRAYRLQDEGLDTIDADRYLGFAADDRDYGAAVAMLKSLGIARIRLMTNNPKKIAAMEAGGIEVVERVALHGPVNSFNARYIETKQDRAGHLKPE
ncbi:MAG: GTP cyclohydrolase II [Burkholderiaceae bacterium]|nr:GTP cyclohydrolase II [Burkholderiaceae bacterium]